MNTLNDLISNFAGLRLTDRRTTVYGALIQRGLLYDLSVYKFEASSFNGFTDILLLLLLLHPFNGCLSRTTWASRCQKGKTSLDLNDAREMMGFGDGSGISWTICKQSEPHCRQITTPTPHHTIFYRPDALPATQPTVSKH